MNEIWKKTCFVNQKNTVLIVDCFDPVIPRNRDIFWDDYHTVKISYRYNPSTFSAF